MSFTNISAKGRLAIPKELRDKYDLRTGTKITLLDYGGILVIVPAMTNPIKQARGMLKGGASLLDALAEEKKRERKR